MVSDKGGTQSMEQKRILVVEDESIVANDIRRTLELLGYHVDNLSSGEEALSYVAQEPPDLIVMDIVLDGDIDGIDAAEQVKIGYRIPVVYLTSHSDPHTIEKVRHTSPYGYVLKPFDEKTLSTTIEIALQQREMEQKLEESEERFRSLFENHPDAVLAFDSDGRCMNFNGASLSLFDLGPEEMSSLYHIDLVTDANRNEFVRSFDAARKGTPQRAHRIQSICRDGTSRILEITFLPVTINAVNVGVYAIAQDVTDIVHARELQKKLDARLRQVQKMEAIGTLAGGIAHDFNNLLMAIQGRTSLLLLEIGDPASPFRDHLSHIEEIVYSGVSLTRQLLSIARGGKVDMSPMNLNDIVQKSADMFGRTKKEMRMHAKYEQEIWPVIADRGQIDQVLLNLFVNAWQAMPGGGNMYLSTENVSLSDDEARIFHATPGDYVVLSITDTGVGMDEETQQHIFEPFFTTKELERGSGLGLASVYGIVKQHDGFVDVTSSPGTGSTFAIYLPARRNITIEKDAPLLREDIVRGEGRILLVDDEEMILEVGRDLLQALGYTVTTASNGQEALDIYQKESPTFDLVILDMIMPDMDGAEVFSRLKKVDPSATVLLSSGYSPGHQTREMMDLGCVGFIQKPFSAKVLSHEINNILSSCPAVQ